MIIMDPEKNTPADCLRNESGFTLLEIIAVIVILSILAVVAVPKYFDLQDKARQRAIGAALAEGIGRVNGYFAEQVLDGNRPGDIDYSDTTLGTDLGDFTLSVSPEGSDNESSTFTITVTGKEGSPVGTLTTSQIVHKPGI